MSVHTIITKTISIDTSKYTIFDSPVEKIVFIRFHGFPHRVVLWNSDQYDTIGDYTQAMIDSRIIELLGDNPQEYLQNLANTIQPIY